MKNFSLELADGDIYSVIGPSGSGKSTLLYVLSGIRTNYTGEVLIDGKRPDPKHQSIGLVPQNYGLLPWKRVKENIFLPERIKRKHAATNSSGAKPSFGDTHVQEIIRTLDLGELLHRYPHELSGGQQQRVALARSFIQKPDLLLMDEPFSALDALTAERSRKLFFDVWTKNPVTTLFITHNIDEAVSIGKRVLLLSPSPGQVTHILDAPTASEVRNLIADQWT
nr:ATP-binding cassette domain-containing protein [Bacteroides sp. 51]